MPTESRKSFVGVNTYHFILFYIKDSSAQNKGCPGHSIIHVTAVLYHKSTCIGINTLSYNWCISGSTQQKLYQIILQMYPSLHELVQVDD